TLLIGAAAILLAGLGLATRPPFLVMVALQPAIGYGTGVLESALNAYLTGRAGSTTLLNRLHAFFGVGALAGPLLAASMLPVVAWPRVWLVLALLCLPLLLGFLVSYPSQPLRRPAVTEPAVPQRLLVEALRQPAVVLAAVFLAVYVGLEQSIGNW